MPGERSSSDRDQKGRFHVAKLWRHFADNLR